MHQTGVKNSHLAHVDVPGASPLIRIDLVQRDTMVKEAGIQASDVHRDVLLIQLLEERGDRVLRGDIDLYGDGSRARLLDFGGHSL
jgi:hypothetical protein